MTLREKAKEMFGDSYIKQCPSKAFRIACFANNDYPYCGTESCWVFHKTDIIQYKDNLKDVLSQQIIGS